MAENNHNVVQAVRQSPPVDTSKPYDAANVQGKTILITGGASGFGAGFTRHWASLGANIIVADISDANGKALVEEIRKKSGNKHHHYIHCDVSDWQSQVDLFRSAMALSPNGRLDSVVANAGITDSGPPFDFPQGLDAETPPKPTWKCLDINLTGVLYTAHLAIFWLQRHQPPGRPAEIDKNHTASDRHLLLLGSVASLAPIPGQIQYAVAKHGVLGLFRSLRSTAFMNSLRVNLLCPYFIDTPLIPAAGRALLAGGATGKPEDVVDAGTRFMADDTIYGRALVIGPKVRIDDEWQLLPQTSEKGHEIAVWEAYAHDFEEVDVFTHRFVQLVNAVERSRGWYGYAIDMIRAALYPFRGLWR